MLPDVFESFQNICLKIYELDPTKVLAALGLAWQAALKKTKVKLDLLTDIIMILILIYVINGRKRYKRRNMSLYLSICKSHNRYMKDYDKNKESSYIQYWHKNNSYGQ